MSSFAGITMFPRRFGGSGVGIPHSSRLKLILDSLNAQRGVGALDAQTRTTSVWAENMAAARGLEAIWAGNARLANQWQPLKMTDFLARWEGILGIYPLASDSLLTRRQRIAAAFLRFSQFPTFQQLSDFLTLALGSGVFVGLVHTPSASATVYTPVGWPVGVQDPTGQKDWYSSVGYIAVQVQQPASMDDGTFYSTVAQLYPLTDGFLPSWVTIDWYRNGPSGTGFVLDDNHNLDNEAFDF